MTIRVPFLDEAEFRENIPNLRRVTDSDNLGILAGDVFPSHALHVLRGYRGDLFRIRVQIVCGKPILLDRTSSNGHE
jgi:hypothetical protein